MPRRARRWGLARKILNVFLRDCLYTTYLEHAYGLRRSEEWYELPLDSITVRELRKGAPRGTLPKWRGVIHLTPVESGAFQAKASQEAARFGLARAHLDAVWWSVLRDN